MPNQEGYLTFKEHRIWYRIVDKDNSADKLPILCLHGGPGANHLYLKPLEELAKTGRRVIFYDQLGNGNSDHPADPSLWTVSYYVEELAAVRKHLGLEELHIYGQSWGGMLAMEYYFTRPSGIASMILSDSLASSAQWESEAQRLRADLPAEMQDTLHRHETAGTTSDKEYQAVMTEYYGRHLCRLKEWPDYLVKSFEMATRHPEVYAAMWGPSEFFITGTLKNWDIRKRLGEINLPVLVLSGRYDESTPLVSGELANNIPGAKWVIFENSAHMPHIEEAELYIRTLDEFLSATEKKQS